MGVTYIRTENLGGGIKTESEIITPGKYYD